MKHNYFLVLFVFLNIILVPKNAYGDEVWSTEEYTVTYLEDRKTTAVWSYGDELGHIFIEGLGGKFKNRGSYNGYMALDYLGMNQDGLSLRTEKKPFYSSLTIIKLFICRRLKIILF